MSLPVYPEEFWWLNLPLDEVLEYYEDVEAEADPETRKEQLRHLVRNDLFYLLVYVCKRDDMLHPWIFERCREVQGFPDGFLDLWAREHYKSTIITFGMTLLTILNNPEATIGIFSHTRDIAQDFLSQIKNELQNNPDLKYLFDDILYEEPERHAPQWSSKDGLVVKRKSNPKEATVEAWGIVDGSPTGRHFSHRIYDDLVTEKSVTSPEMIHKTTAAWRLSDNLGKTDHIGDEPPIERYVGTRYSEFDTYRVMIDESLVQVRLHPATSDGSDDPRLSVLMPVDLLAQKRRKHGPYIFGCQMLLNPRGDRTVGFQEAWLREWEAEHARGLNVGIIVDPSSGKNREKAKNDYTSMWVIGLGGDGNWYVLDIVRDRLRLSERAKTLIALHRRWKPNPQLVFYEETGYAADIEHCEYVMKEINYRFDITAINPHGLSKPARIQKLVPVFESGRIYLPPSIIKRDWENKTVNLVKIFKEEEYLAYPVLKHDDMLDALSQLEHEDVLRRWQKPKDTEPGDYALRQIANLARKQRRKQMV